MTAASGQCGDGTMLNMEIIGNLTRDPESRTIKRDGGDRTVCNFTVAVNRVGREEAAFVRVAVWGKSGENCQKYLARGRMVFVRGEPSVHVWTSRDGEARGELEITADPMGGVEFLTPRGSGEQQEAFRQDTGAEPSDVNGYVEVEDEQLPF